MDDSSQAGQPDRFGWSARRLAVSITARMNGLDATDNFARRHIGPSTDDRDCMLAAVGAASLDALMEEAIPASIHLKRPLNLPPAESEHEYLRRLTHIARRNRTFRSYIGLGYHDTITPSVILRLVMENPAWYTPYTPYQAEIAQGRLESLLNFQTMVADLTGMEVANASLLDEATAAAEAMTLLHRVRTNKPGTGERGLFLVSDRCLPQTIDVLKARAEPLDIDLHVGPTGSMRFDARVFGVMLQYPDEFGAIEDLSPFIGRAHGAGVLAAVGTDLLALALVTPPGEMGADVVFGTSQRFGVPLGYGGPHAAFFATRNAFVRQMPGRIIGVSVDAHGRKAYRMALATREQHIRRERATSNICTAQALLANMAAMYAVYHGPEGLRAIASRVHALAGVLERALQSLGLSQVNPHYFDTLQVAVPQGVETVRPHALEHGINFRYVDERTIGIALNETVSSRDVRDIVEVFAEATGRPMPTANDLDPVTAGVIDRLAAPAALRRQSPFLKHPVFNSHHSE